MPMEYILPSLRIAQITVMTDTDTVEERLAHLLALEEDRFIVGFHQKVQKAREKAWHDRHIKNKTFQIGDLVLLYDSKFIKFPGKLRLAGAISDTASYRGRCHSAQPAERGASSHMD